MKHVGLSMYIFIFLPSSAPLLLSLSHPPFPSLSLKLFLFLPSSLRFFQCCFLLTRPHTVNKGYCISCRVTASSLFTVDMVDTQQLLAWPVGFSLSAVDLSSELDDSSHSLDMKHLSTLDYASISSSSIQSSLSPPLVSCISSAGVAYDPSPPQSEEHLTNMDYTNMHSYRMEPDTHSKSCLCNGLTRAKTRYLLSFC